MNARESVAPCAERLLAAGLVTLLTAACGFLDEFANPPRAARWGLPADADIGPDTTFFIAMVTETACASGLSSATRIVPPHISYDAESVTITFAVEPRSGPQECPANPSTVATVRLDEPLGDRVLLDGGTDPPREPPICRNADFCE